MLVILLTVIDYFSKKVVNDVIKLEVSTGVGIFLLKSNKFWLRDISIGVNQFLSSIRIRKG